MNRVYCDYIANGSNPTELREIAERLEELEALGCEIEESTSHEQVLGWRITTDDVYIAARFEFPWVTEPDEDGEHPEYVEWSWDTPTNVEHAEYEDEDYLDDAAFEKHLAEVKAQVAAARAENEAQAAATRAKAVEDMKAEFAALMAKIPTLHPYVQAQAYAVARSLNATEQNFITMEAACPTMSAMSDVLARLRTAVAGIVSGVANGRRYEIHTGNIGGQRVDHLRENGLIGMVEGRVSWAPGTSQEAYKRAIKVAREFYRPSEVYDILQRAAVTA